MCYVVLFFLFCSFFVIFFADNVCLYGYTLCIICTLSLYIVVFFVYFTCFKLLYCLLCHFILYWCDKLMYGIRYIFYIFTVIYWCFVVLIFSFKFYMNAMSCIPLFSRYIYIYMYINIYEVPHSLVFRGQII